MLLPDLDVALPLKVVRALESVAPACSAVLDDIPYLWHEFGDSMLLLPDGHPSPAGQPPAYRGSSVT